MKGTTADDWASHITIPSSIKIITIGTIHQSLFCQRNANNSLITDSFDFILWANFMFRLYQFMPV